MIRMVSRTKFPPGEWQVLHPEAGMKEPFHGSFQEAVNWEMNFRLRNPGLAQKLGLPADEAQVATYVDHYNAQRCLAGGWSNFVMQDSAADPTPQFTQALEKKTLAGGVVAGAKAVWAAGATFKDMFGSMGVVANATAQARAGICVGCPQNDTSKTLWAWFSKAVADEITSLYEGLNAASMTTDVDDKLGVCKACLCPMKAKVHVRIEHIAAHMPADVWPQLNKSAPKCWILVEAKR